MTLDYTPDSLACLSDADLIPFLQVCANCYYQCGESPIRDQDYDRLIKEAERRGLPLPSFDDRKKAEDFDEDELNRLETFGASVEHSVPMLSMANAYVKPELDKFLKKYQTGHKFYLDYKVDGIALALCYNHGKLERALTRGDGVCGRDITEVARLFHDVPNEIEITRKFEVRGEVYIPTDAFNRINRERVKEGQKPYANNRNLVCGTLANDEDNLPRLVKERELSFIAHTYVLGYRRSFSFGAAKTERNAALNEKLKELTVSESYKDYVATLALLGFRVVPGVSDVFRDDVYNEVLRLKEKSYEQDFESDGIVVKLDDLILRERDENTLDKHTWEIACKFFACEAETTLREIEFQTGATGQITPVAVFDPVKLDGAEVKRASLAGYGTFCDLAPAMNDAILVEKAGKIIPRVKRVLYEKRSGKEKAFQFPENCPVCGAKLDVIPGARLVFCKNRDCEARKLQGMIKFCKTLGIKGIGEREAEILGKLVQYEPLKLYSLKSDDVRELGKKSAVNFIVDLEKSKSLPTWRVLVALGIPSIGEDTAKSILCGIKQRHVSGLYELLIAKNPKTQDERLIANALAGREELLIQSGLDLFRIDDVPLKTSYCVTGTFPVSREEIKERLAARGVRVTDAVSKKTAKLIVGAKPSQKKVDKAVELGVPVERWENE